MNGGDDEAVFLLRDGEAIELHDLLKTTGLCPTGGTAKVAIQEGMVAVDGIVERRRRRKIRRGQVVQFGERMIRTT